MAGRAAGTLLVMFGIQLRMMAVLAIDVLLYLLHHQYAGHDRPVQLGHFCFRMAAKTTGMAVITQF
jgi:hypothetical protein